jgi:hypothetical protein
MAYREVRIRQQMGRPGAAVAAGVAEQRLKLRTDQIRAWLGKDNLLLTKAHELLGREGLVVSYSALYRFARKWCDFGTACAMTVLEGTLISNKKGPSDSISTFSLAISLREWMA